MPQKISQVQVASSIGSNVRKQPRKVWISGAGATAVILLFVAVLRARHTQQEKSEYQKIANETQWSPAESAQDLFRCVDADTDSNCQIELIFPPHRGGESITIRFVRDGKPIYSFRGGPYSIFVESDDQLVYADYSPADCGCTLVAVDLKTGQEIWRSALEAVGQTSHFAYRNSVSMDLRGECIEVYGDESLGKYVEFVDFKSGETVAHRLFP